LCAVRGLAHAPLPAPIPAGDDDVLQILAWVQGAYFVLTGVWPLLSMGSFERVTGPKTDRWLVRTVGVLVIAIGLSIALGSRHGPFGMLRLLAIGSAVGLAAIDVVYASRRVIARIYLADAAAQVVFAIAWALTPDRWT
jgi:hypothetical protein